jgi:hypothetical protein
MNNEKGDQQKKTLHGLYTGIWFVGRGESVSISDWGVVSGFPFQKRLEIFDLEKFELKDQKFKSCLKRGLNHHFEMYLAVSSCPRPLEFGHVLLVVQREEGQHHLLFKYFKILKIWEAKQASGYEDWRMWDHVMIIIRFGF